MGRVGEPGARYAGGRRPQDVDLAAVQAVLDTVDLVDVTRGDLLSAGTHAPLRSNDAIQMAVAIRVGADALITYDAELIELASAVGLAARSPGGAG